MQILIVSQHFWPENFLINQVVTELTAQGAGVTVLTGKPNYPRGKIFAGYKFSGVHVEEYQGAKIIRIPIFPRGHGSKISLILNYLSFIFFGLVCFPFLLRKQKFDVVFVYATSPLLQALPALLVSRIKRVPLVLWVQDLWPDVLKSTGYVNNTFILECVSKIVKYIYRFSDLILIQSEAFRYSIQKLLHPCTWNKIQYFGNFSDDLSQFFFKIDDSNKITEELKKNFSIVFAGNIGLVQSCETILQAAELLKENSEIQFYLVGDGSRTNYIADQIQKLNLKNIKMVGLLPPEKMPAIFNSASALLVSLKNDANLSATVPNKLQNYMSSRKPILGSLKGEAARVILEANAGFVSEPENAEELKNIILKLYFMTKQERDQLGQNAYDYFTQYFFIKNRIKILFDMLKNQSKININS